MTPVGVEPATFRFVAQRLNRCATAVPAEYISCGDSQKRRGGSGLYGCGINLLELSCQHVPYHGVRHYKKNFALSP